MGLDVAFVSYGLLDVRGLFELVCVVLEFGVWGLLVSLPSVLGVNSVVDV